MPLREIAAVARQGWLIGTRGLGLRPETVPAEGAECAVAFVHGFMAAGPVFDPLRAQVAAAGMATVDFTYAPTGRFEIIAGELAETLHRAAEGKRLALVGHSLGGLLCRWVMQKHGVPARKLVTIATPHGGTEIARRWPLPLAKALRPGSEVLAELAPPGVPHTAIVAGRDTMVRPVASAAPEGARVHWLTEVGHNGVLFDGDAHRLVTGALRAWQRAETGASPRNAAAE